MNVIVIYSVIVTFNGEKWIKQCLNSLQSSDVNLHIIVVDNASTDNTVKLVESDYPNVTLVKNSKNRGFGVGNNIGISLAIENGAEFIFLLNQDAYITNFTLTKLLNFIKDHEEFGVVTPLHCSPDFYNIDKKTLRGYIHPYAYQYLSDACVNKIKEFYQIRGVNAAAWFVRSSVFQNVGGFDPVFFMYGEDDDLINRLDYHGVGFALLPDSKIVHLRETSKVSHASYYDDILMMAARRRSSLIVELKQPDFTSIQIFLLLVSSGIISPLAYFLIERDIRKFLGRLLACFQVFFRLPIIRKHARLCAAKGGHFLFDVSLH